MKTITHALFTLVAVAAIAALASCGTDGNHFKIDGRLLNLNQGEFYVYSLEGGEKALDTIKVQAGRFTYDVECTSPKTLMIVFPNFTEQPVFAQPGKSVDIKGDASHLKEMTVKGTKDNELMNSFREQIHSASPLEQAKYARQFVEDHPASLVSPYLVRRYFIANVRPDLRTAADLLKRIEAAQPDNGYVHRLQGMISGRAIINAGSNLPQFRTSTIDGSFISSKQLLAAPNAVVVAWASWNFNSLSMLRMLLQNQQDKAEKPLIVSICLDPSVETCKKTMEQNNISCPTVCDGNMVDGTLFKKLGLSSVPDNILIQNGKITGVSLSNEELSSRLN